MHSEGLRRAHLTAYDREQRIEIEYPDHRKEVLPQVVRFVRTVEPGRGFIRYTWLEGADPAHLVQEQVDYFRELGIPFDTKCTLRVRGRRVCLVRKARPAY